jgi:hypothetical protein
MISLSMACRAAKQKKTRNWSSRYTYWQQLIMRPNQTLAGMLDKLLLIIANEKSVENLSHSCAVITHSTWISLHKIKLSVNAPCLWALVHHLIPVSSPIWVHPETERNWVLLLMNYDTVDQFLVWPFNPCLIPNLSVARNWAKLSTLFNELCYWVSVLGLTL